MQQKQEINKIVQAHRLTAVYAYVPLCGTCRLAGKMIEVVERAAADFKWVRLDLNYNESFAAHYSIESVPCLLIFKEGQLQEKMYAFQSVPYIYEKLGQYS